MAKATNDQIYDIQAAIEKGALDILSSSCYIPNTYDSRHTASKQTPSAEVQFYLGQPTGHVTMISGSINYDSWNGQLNVMLITDRALNPLSHSMIVSRTRNNLSRELLWKSRDTLPYHVVVKSTNSNCINQMDVENGLDITAMTFEQTIFVKPTAWP